MKRRPIILIAALFILPQAAFGQSNDSRVSAKQLAKAEHLIAQLQQLDDFINSGPDSAQYKARIAKLSDALNQAAGNLPEGDLKTDLATAVYWYEQLSQDFSHSSVSRLPSTSSESLASRCTSERPGVYQKLCEDTSGSLRDLSWSKARLHLSWARAGIAFQKTGTVDRPLDDIAVERRFDQTLAARALELLKVLETEVVVYQSLGSFEAGGKLARVPFAVFKRDLQKVSADTEAILSWLPQNRLKVELSNALHSYQDGGFWWERSDQPRVVKASDMLATDFNRSPAEAAYMTTVPYTVAINWRLASKYLKRAEALMKSRD